MKHHRFYLPPAKRELRHELWIDDQHLVHQWTKVLRLKQGDELVLFDGVEHERLYKVMLQKPDSYKLEYITDLEPQKPVKHLYLFWAMLKKDKNEFVIQKCTELGVSNFVPIITDRTEAKYIDQERLEKIAIEASEQCGRADIPRIHEPKSLESILSIYGDKLTIVVADQEGGVNDFLGNKDMGGLVGPEGGWTVAEKELLKVHGVQALGLSRHTLRAETASIVLSAELMGGRTNEKNA